MVLFAYLVQGYFDALRSRMLCRVATLFDVGLQRSIHTALATLPLRGVKPILMQQPLRDLDQIRTFMSGMGPTAFLDMPWIPIFLVALFLFHPAIGMTALVGTAAIIAMTLLTERMSRGAVKAAMDSSALRQVLADETQHNAEVIRALGMTDRLGARWPRSNESYLQQCNRHVCQPRVKREGTALRSAIRSAGDRRLSRRGRQGVGRDHDRFLDHDGPRARTDRNSARELETARGRALGHLAAA
jgi:ABC-type protease/lipase transport system fused ATPase/permease subunit